MMAALFWWARLQSWERHCRHRMAVSLHVDWWTLVSKAGGSPGELRMGLQSGGWRC